MSNREILTAYAREMRANPTPAEKNLFFALRCLRVGVKFRFQMPIGTFIVDFVCLSHRLIVEVDGNQHGEANAYDRERDAWLTAQGFRVLRFGNDSVLKELEGVLMVIEQALFGGDGGTTPYKSPVKGDN